eukprot:scaffold87912_cov42-Prasinocladus_malaysianus.AAC.1
MSGDYRYLLQRPEDMSWSFSRYSNPTQDLSLTGLQRLNTTSDQREGCHTDPCINGVPRASGSGIKRHDNDDDDSQADHATTKHTTSDNKNDEGRNEGPYLALRLRFILPSSAYATMLIREATKESSSTKHHTSLNLTASPVQEA